MTVENISIDVKTNAGSAARQFRSLSSALNGVRSAGRSVSSGGTHKAIAKVGSAAKTASGHVGKLFASIKRIAFYRLLRTVIKEITQAFNEGLKNAYHFSKGIGGSLAATLDGLTTKSLTMKNQMGAAFGALLQAIAPIILQIISLVTRLMQALSALFAAIGGGQYLIAKDTATAWDKATGAAQKYKNTILGFDEINRLDDPNSGGGGGGADWGSMFEEGKLPEWAQAISDKLKQLKESLDFSKIKESWDRLKESARGLADVIGRGLGWAWDNVLVPLARWTIQELAPRLVDLLATALDFLRAVLEKLGPILEPLWENVLKPFFEWCGDLVLDGLDELIDLLEDFTKLIDGEISWDEFISGLDGVQIALLALGGLAVLNAIGKVTTGIMSIPASIAKAIPKMATGLAQMAKTAATGALGVFDAVMIAYDAAKLKEAADTFHEAQEAHNHETEVSLSTYAKLYKEKGKEAADQWALMVHDIDTTNMSFEEAQEAITQKIDSYWEGTPQNMWDGFKQGWRQWFGEDGKNLWDLIKAAFENVIQWIKDLLGIHSPSTVFAGIGSDMVQGLWNGFKEKWDQFFSNLQGWWNNLQTWWDGLSLKTIVANVTGGTTINTNGLSHDSGKFATGGFPDVGELFVAREAGPELVGSINGHSAVANNDQIVEAVASGVYEAVSSAMSNTNERPMQVRVYLDSREIRVGQNRYAMAMGV